MSIYTQLNQKYHSGDEETKRSTVNDLRSIPLSESYPLLFEAMGDESWRIRKEAVAVFVAGQPDETLICSILELFRNGDNAGQRNSAAEAVALIGSKALNPLLARLHDDDADVRKIVVDVLGSIGSPECIQYLSESLNDSDINVAAASAEQLGVLGDASVVPCLIKAIVQNKNDFFRFNALAAIGKLAAPAPVPDEIVALTSDNILKKATFECLGSIADETALPILLDGINGKQKSARHAAIIALYRIYERSTPEVRNKISESLKKLRGSEIVSAIMDSYNPYDNMRCEAVITLLDMIEDSSSIPIFVQAISNECTASKALAAIKRFPSEVLQEVFSSFQTSDEMVKVAICFIAAESPSDLALLTLRRGVSDPSPLVRHASLSALGKLGYLEALPEVIQAIDDDDADVKNAAVSALLSFTSIDSQVLTELTKTLAGDHEAEHRKVAAELAAALDNSECLTLLVKDESPSVREAAVSALGNVGGVDFAGIIQMALFDEDPDVRIAAAEAIGKTGCMEQVHTLVSAMNDDDIWVRCAILKNLTKLDRNVAFDVIKNLFPTASGLLMITALEQLDFIATPEAIELVKSVISSSERDIADLAKEIFSRHLDLQVNK